MIIYLQLEVSQISPFLRIDQLVIFSIYGNLFINELENQSVFKFARSYVVI